LIWYKLEDLINGFGASLVVIACFLNRSGKNEWNGKPVLSLNYRPEPQWKQEDPVVAADIQAGNVVWEAKKEWPKLKKAMEESAGVAVSTDRLKLIADLIAKLGLDTKPLEELRSMLSS